MLFSYQSNDQFSALQAAFEGEGAAKDAANCRLLVGDPDPRRPDSHATSCATLLDVYLMQRFIIRWRVWLTHRLTGDWLDGDAYYRGRFVDDPIDNPDQRIQQDIDIFTTGTGQKPTHRPSGQPKPCCSVTGIRHRVAASSSPRFCGAWRAR